MNSGIADVREGRTRERTSWQREQRWNGVLGHVGYLMLLKEERLRTGFLPCAELSESSVPAEVRSFFRAARTRITLSRLGSR